MALTILLDLAMIAWPGLSPHGLPSPCKNSGAWSARPLAASFSLAASCTVIGTLYRSSFFSARFLSPPLADFGIISFGRTG